MMENLILLGAASLTALLPAIRIDGGVISIDWEALSRIVPEVIVLAFFIWYNLRTTAASNKTIETLTDRCAKSVESSSAVFAAALERMSKEWNASIAKLVEDHRAASEKRDDVTIQTLKMVSDSHSVVLAKVAGLTEEMRELSQGIELGLFKSILDEDNNTNGNSTNTD